MTLTLEQIISTKEDAKVSPPKPKPGLSLTEWREYRRRIYIRELRRVTVRRQAGWTDSPAEYWFLIAEIQLTHTSIRTRTIKRGIISVDT